MNLTEGFKDEETGILNEIIQTSYEEEIITKYKFALPEFLLSTVEVKIDTETFHEFSDRVTISVALLLNNLNEVLHVLPSLSTRDNGCGQITEYVRTHRLDGVEIGQEGL